MTAEVGSPDGLRLPGGCGGRGAAAASAEKTAKVVKGAELKVYKGGSHGFAQVDPETFIAGALAFVRS